MGIDDDNFQKKTSKPPVERDAPDAVSQSDRIFKKRSLVGCPLDGKLRHTAVIRVVVHERL